MTDDQLNEIIEALKKKALGNLAETIVEEYSLDENKKQKLDKKTVKKIKNEIDTQACIKLIDIELKRRELIKNQTNFDELSDEELEKEKQRLLKEYFQTGF